jgi:hypothetical protein
MAKALGANWHSCNHTVTPAIQGEKINLKIILIDGIQLAQLMIDHDVGVTEASRYIVKRWIPTNSLPYDRPGYDFARNLQR